MHTHTIRTKFTFGDRVRYSSQLNSTGEGTVVAISFDADSKVCYYIEPDSKEYWQGGIEEHEMTLIDPEADLASLFQ